MHSEGLLAETAPLQVLTPGAGAQPGENLNAVSSLKSPRVRFGRDPPVGDVLAPKEGPVEAKSGLAALGDTGERLHAAIESGVPLLACITAAGQQASEGCGEHRQAKERRRAPVPHTESPRDSSALPRTGIRTYDDGHRLRRSSNLTLSVCS